MACWTFSLAFAMASSVGAEEEKNFVRKDMCVGVCVCVCGGNGRAAKGRGDEDVLYGDGVVEEGASDGDGRVGRGVERDEKRDAVETDGGDGAAAAVTGAATAAARREDGRMAAAAVDTTGTRRVWPIWGIRAGIREAVLCTASRDRGWDGDGDGDGWRGCVVLPRVCWPRVFRISRLSQAWRFGLGWEAETRTRPARWGGSIRKTVALMM